MPRKKSELDQACEERDSLRRRVNELERLLARLEPESVLTKLPEPLQEYTPELPQKVLALAVVGLATSELRAELGMSLQQQVDWQAEHPQFAAAINRAKDLAHAYWQRLSRQSLEGKDWKFPYAQTQRFVETMLQDEDGESVARGDASELIHLHIDECPKCGYSAEEQ